MGFVETQLELGRNLADRRDGGQFRLGELGRLEQHD
jgi:hypothetical protein